MLIAGRKAVSRILSWFSRLGSRSPQQAPQTKTSGLKRDPYRGVVGVISITVYLGMVGAFVGGLTTGSWVLLDGAISLGISAGILMGVFLAQSERLRSSNIQDTGGHEATNGKRKYRLKRLNEIRQTALVTAIVGLAANLLLILCHQAYARLSTPSVFECLISTSLCLGAATLAITAASYLADIEPAGFPEARGLSQLARIDAWILFLAALSMVSASARQSSVLQVLHVTVLSFNIALCCNLLASHLASRRAKKAATSIFPLDLGVLSAFGSRTNILASLLDAAERQLGIDLRSTWALAVVRRSLEPLLMALALVGWFSTSLTVIGIDEQGLVEHFGVPVQGDPLQPGIHFHWPWPVDQVYRIPMQRVQAIQVGHEGEESDGPENVLWAVEHAPNEYTLLLGNGRDLITVDAAVQFRITDARAWRYHMQNPGEALRAIAYRAVMRSTVNRTLSDTLSENLVTLAHQMRKMVQDDANALGLGVEIVAFTVGGMHPPVPVASSYEAVVSAQLGKVTSVVDAQAYHNEIVPKAEASVVTDENKARADGAQALALSAGQAWSFRALEAQYRASPGDYMFRRRLETLESVLPKRRFTIMDSRFQRDGGELWLEQ